MPREHIHFVTGKLAEPSLRKLLPELSERVGFDYSISPLNITVAALMTTEWIAKRLQIPPETTRVILPGYSSGDLEVVANHVQRPVERGPKDLRKLPEHFGQRARPSDYGAYDIEILAEINHAPRFSTAEIVRQAEKLRADGADLIDVGCNPGETWPGVADAVRALRGAGHRVSIDSLNMTEIEAAVGAGAELVLSVNSSNRERAPDWGCEVVVIPDDPESLLEFDTTVAYLAERGVPVRLDPILEPIGFGFARSLQRYLHVRDRYPDAEMMMGIGNLTELTDVDSAGVNVLLLGICQELSIRSVLTTQVANWARTSVRECDLARRLVYHSLHNRVLPKHVEPRLVTLRDPENPVFGIETLGRLAGDIRDNNYRLFAEGELLHVLSSGERIEGVDPFEIWEAILAKREKPIDAGHAFYLGYEMAKARIALTLNKDYRQDEALDWGYLTLPEESHRERRKRLGKSAEATDTN